MPALILGCLLTMWGAVELVATPARDAWSKARGRRMRSHLVITATPGRTVVALGTPGSPPPGGTHPAHAFGSPVVGRVADFAWISVRNDQVRPQGDAIAVSGDLTFYDGDHGRFSFPARWRDSLQVWQTGMDTSPISNRLDIRATRTREMDCAPIYDGEDTAHGFNTEGRVWPWWQKPHWALCPGAYRVRLRIAGENVDPMEAWFDLTVGPTGGMRFTDRR